MKNAEASGKEELIARFQEKRPLEGLTVKKEITEKYGKVKRKYNTGKRKTPRK